MVSILPSARSPLDVIGSELGSNLSQVLPQAISGMQERQRGESALDRAQKDIAGAGGDPFKIAMAFARVGAQSPNLSRALGPLYETAMSQAAAQRAGGIPLPGEGQPQPRETLQAPSQQQLPERGFGPAQGQNQNFPTNLGPQGGPGQAPQAATTGVKVPLLTPQEKIQEAKTLAANSTKAGIPLSPRDALAQVEESELSKKAHNDEVDKELGQRVESQQRYGTQAVEQLKKTLPKATPEQEAIFKKKGEEASRKGWSEAEIDRYLAKEADKFANAFVNVEKAVSAPRIQNKITSALNGSYKTLEEAADDMRSYLKPILDEGLYDTARSLLQDKGYGLEERESIINPIAERTKILLNQVPEVPREKTKGAGVGIPGHTGYEFRAPADIENIKSSLMEIQKSDPNFSLPLVRKMFDDKGYGWKDFNKALNELEKEGFEFSDDQKTHRGELDTPPLHTLDKILHGLNIIGR
jgi:hypothetical protein